jgi:hypothetical protein
MTMAAVADAAPDSTHVRGRAIRGARIHHGQLAARAGGRSTAAPAGVWPVPTASSGHRPVPRRFGGDLAEAATGDPRHIVRQSLMVLHEGGRNKPPTSRAVGCVDE